MVQCEMCGKSVDRLTLGIIEGAELNVCPDCLKLGRKKEKPNVVKHKFTSISKGPEEIVIQNSGSLIKTKREQMGLRQQDLAKMLQIKDSFLHHIEIGDMPLKIDLAKRLEETLQITLVKIVKAQNLDDDTSLDKASGMTLGDLIKIKKSNLK